MNEHVFDLLTKAGGHYDGKNHLTGKTRVCTDDVDYEKFAELIVLECIKIAVNQRDPANLNYKPSDRFVEDLKQHFGVKE